MSNDTDRVDHELVRAATEVVRAHHLGENHTVAAAGRAADGRFFTALNVYHFTGGPCAELVLIGTAAAQGAHELKSVVAVGDTGRDVIPPCGRCRQTLLDYFPTVGVILDTAEGLRTVPVADLLPHSYRHADHC
ncbi:cytidine deaminase [Streptomyces sp. XM4193]|uniref:cytidine deaminase family protein n=1 Tax=Streptomyces sp. XM4193 TaxID=2929782 RepID=UPI001FF90B2F|nr:cytidine deaminase [Streptomyces sp. XM4193]MCK1795754.1 cytidine deaminase [Streptomyces sp. XM4193]